MDITTPRSAATFDVWDRKEGTPGPMGVTWVPSLNAWNFGLYSRRASGVSLLLYSADEFVAPLLEYRLDVRANKSGRIWHCWVPLERAASAACYAWRVEGRHDPDAGFRFDSDKILLDPFAPLVFSRRTTIASLHAGPDQTMAARHSVSCRKSRRESCFATSLKRPGPATI